MTKLPLTPVEQEAVGVISGGRLESLHRANMRVVLMCHACKHWQPGPRECECAILVPTMGMHWGCCDGVPA